MNSPQQRFSAHPTVKTPKRLVRSLLEAGAADNSQLATSERLRLAAEWKTLHEREENLRAFELQLRAMQADIDARRTPEIPTSVSPFPAGELSLQSAWDKLIRARELLEAEQTNFREDRMAMRAELADLKRRQANFAVRQAALTAREESLSRAELAADSAAEPIAAQHTMSVMTRLTRSPFHFARSILRGGK